MTLASMPLQRLRSRWIVAGLIAITFVAYWQVHAFSFVNMDDPDYVTKNALVKNGFSSANIGRVFTTSHAMNWHPATWLSLMADYQLFGMKPRAFHLHNLALHLVNVLLLFMTLARFTHQPWRAGLVAVLFAIHPLHVESVAWVSERKDVLSTLFLLLILQAYFRYALKPRLRTYILVLLLFALGVMSKQSLVTLPFVLLLLDLWPLYRLRPFRRPQAGQPPADSVGPVPAEGVAATTTVRKLVIEKLPLLLLSAAAASMTLWAQREAITSASDVLRSPLPMRIQNAVVSYGSYLYQTVWPVGLCCFYPYDGRQLTWPLVATVAAALLTITGLAIRVVDKNPAILVGWLWYLGTLVPVIGLIQVGGQSMADRYTYVPLIGIFIAIAWSLPNLSRHLSLQSWLLIVVSTAIGCLTVLCHYQVSTWKNTETLFRHALTLYPTNGRAAFFLAQDLLQQGRLPEAAKLYREAARLAPLDESIQSECGSRLAQAGYYREAADCFAAASQLQPSLAVHHHHRGLMLLQLRDLKGAAFEFRLAIEAEPKESAPHGDLGAVLMEMGQWSLAETELREAIRLNPQDARAQHNLRVLLSRIQ